MIRLPRVEQMLGCRVDVDCGHGIRRLVAEKTAEFEQLDWKQELPDNNGLAKDVAAFANHQGGLIVVGVADAKGVAGKAFPMAVTDADLRNVRTVVAGHVVPLPDYEVFAVPDPDDDGKAFLVIVIGRSERAPHGVEFGDTGVRYPVRDGSQTRWMHQSEVADRYRQREDRRGGRLARLDQVVRDGRGLLEPKGWLTVALVPEHPGSLRISRDTLSMARTWLDPWKQRMSLWGSAPFDGLTVRVGYRSLQLVSDWQVQHETSNYTFVEIHDDGSGFAAWPLETHGLMDARLDPDRNTFPFTALAVTSLTIEFVKLLAEHALHNTATWGNATVEVALTPPADQRLLLCDSTDVRRLHPVENARRSQRDARVRRELNMDDTTTTTAGMLAAVETLTGDLFQTFGVPANPNLDPDGNIRLNQVPAHNRTAVQAWTKTNGAGTV